MENRFGYDFSHVRIHADGESDRLAGSIQARAFTCGRHIYFKRGAFAPASDAGRRLLAHELVHVIQQHSRSNRRANDTIQRKWENSTGHCQDIPATKKLEHVVVEQETPQSVTLYWNDGTMERDLTSTGKGHCCVGPDSSEGVACTVRGSRTSGSNCTPITEDKGYTIKDRYVKYNGWDYWCTIVRGRGIGLHQYPRVSGRPLSHGCIRMKKETARKIFCGAVKDGKSNPTFVKIQGYARPRCDDPDLQEEWRKDFQTGGQNPADFAEAPEYQETIRTTRQMLYKAFGKVLTREEIAKLTVDDIPRCGKSAARPSELEQALIGPAESAEEAKQSRVNRRRPVDPLELAPLRYIYKAGMDKQITALTKALKVSSNFHTARTSVSRLGRKLWQAAAGAEIDDRALYWARLQGTRAVRQWQPKFVLSESQREDLIQSFDNASRGILSVEFKKKYGRKAVRKILVTGFDPWELIGRRGDLRRSNPSGAAALALDGKILKGDSSVAHIQSIVLPVSQASFNTGMIESFFTPYIKPGAKQVDMIVALGMGSSRFFEIEEKAKRPAGATALFSSTLPKQGGSGIPVKLPKELGTTLPTGVMRVARMLARFQRVGTLDEWKQMWMKEGIDERTLDEMIKHIPKPKAMDEYAGAFMCNELFYRLAWLRDNLDPELPVGFVHTPRLNPPSGKNVFSTAHSEGREDIVNRAEKIISAALKIWNK